MTKTLISILSLFLLLLSHQIDAQNQINTAKTPSKTPVLKINFYMMGMDSIDEKITVAIGDNVKYLNDEFEGLIQFELEELFMDINHAYLPDLHTDYKKRKSYRIESTVKAIEQKGAINIFLFRTYSLDGSNHALMGFTPIFRARHGIYKEASPRFDRIFLSYSCLVDKNTLVHEMGHFLGLKHPWELSEGGQRFAGITNDNILNINHMTYNNGVSDFTDQQLKQMHDFVMDYRLYLVKRIVTDFSIR